MYLLICCCSVTHSCPIGFPVHHQLPNLAQTPVHRVANAIQPSHPLSSPSPPAFNLFHYQGLFHQQGLFQWVSSSHQVTRVLEFQLQPSNEYSELVSFRIDGFDVLTVQGNLKSLQPHISKALILQHSVLLMVQVSHPYMMIGKSIGLNIETFVSQVMSLIFNTLSRFVLSLLPRRKHLNFITAVTICSDFGALKIKVCHCFHCFPICLPWSDGTRCHDLSFLNV